MPSIASISIALFALTAITSLVSAAPGDAAITVGKGGAYIVSNPSVTIPVGASVTWSFEGGAYFLYQQPYPKNCTSGMPGAEFGLSTLIASGGSGYSHTFTKTGDYYWFVDQLSSQLQICRSGGGQGVVSVVSQISQGTDAGATTTAATLATTRPAPITAPATQIVVTGAPNNPIGPSVPYVTFSGAASASVGFGAILALMVFAMAL
ncbi:hypothetical protein HDU97_005868 [Phlyctochytrium planicorne]|nr:hypothetical protein HDU97_005868 [Phlyctochytrium planicorne]